MADSHSAAITPPEEEQLSSVDAGVASGGAYEVLQSRLANQGQQLRELALKLNQERLEEFGSSRSELLGRFRVRTENNCIGRDIVQIGGRMLFGYNVFIGLKTTTQVEDVFALYELEKTDNGYDVKALPLTDSFLDDPGFVRDFTELYAYYKGAHLTHMTVLGNRLLAGFQIGERVSEMRVFRWQISPDASQIEYIDNRGERDLAPPPAFDFEWTPTSRDDQVQGSHPHINILDTVFIETVGGDLTIKVENNTEDGLGIWREPVDDVSQSLGDAHIEYARIGTLILIKVLPYRETQWRYLVFNSLTHKVSRNDSIGLACRQLPEDHGIIFPGGYVLESGEMHAFDQNMDGMGFRLMQRSPNGEDVLYVFHEPKSGEFALFTYNLIERELQRPLLANGYALLEDGRMMVFNDDTSEPSRVHPMQLWQSPFTSEEFAARAPERDSPLGRIGNAELVRGISELFSLAQDIQSTEISSQRYERLITATRRLTEHHYWMEASGPKPDMAPLLNGIIATGEAVLDEYEKVASIQAESARLLTEAATRQQQMLLDIRHASWTLARDYAQALGQINQQRGRLISLRELRYMDLAALEKLQQQLEETQQEVAAQTADFLADEASLSPYKEALKEQTGLTEQAATTPELDQVLKSLHDMASELDTLSELMAALRIDDPNQRTRIVEGISEIYAALNQSRARAEQKRRGLGSSEQRAQFGAQFTLFEQGMASALALATDPESCDEQLAHQQVLLEELESQFGEHEEFLTDIITKREALLEAFEARKQALLDERQRRAQGLYDAALRILEGLPRRTERLQERDALNSFFASDALIVKLHELASRLRELQDSVKADDIAARLKAIRDQALRLQSDRNALFEDDGQVIRLGRHRFSVNTQALELTLMPRGEHLHVHLVGTDYMRPIQHPDLDSLQDFWNASFESESAQFSRAEYLALQVLDSAHLANPDDSTAISTQQLAELIHQPDELARAIRNFAAPRYRDGYERGIHDHDAVLILQALLPLREVAGVLAHDARARALAMLYWNEQHGQADDGQHPVTQWSARARNARLLQQVMNSREAEDALAQDIASQLVQFATHDRLTIFTLYPGTPLDTLCYQAGRYLLDELATESHSLHFSSHATRLADTLQTRLKADGNWPALHSALTQPALPLTQRLDMALHWINALASLPEHQADAAYGIEAAALLLFKDDVPHSTQPAQLHTRIEGLLSQHPLIQEGSLWLAVDDFSRRALWHQRHYQPGLQRYQALRQHISSEQRKLLQLDSFRAKPMTSFVRNRLIDQVYLPLIGDNLAKQMGTIGDSKRSDLMGLLMMISPPGYGKTTLLEYVAHRLGLVFMKIDGPSLGHEVRSVDPSRAPDSASRRELEKLNLALEMGNNVMLYVDDIQHTHPEFLQRFISLADGTRRMEGVWQGEPKTYDLRSKKFCLVMAGNPYTESGEVFKIPDMLANRADIYNLGDVLGGQEDIFKLSYIENSLTSNPVLAPMANRDLNDLHLLVSKVQGQDISTNELSHAYSAAELREIEAVLERLLTIREILWRVNQQYIASAAQADAYRTEPPFKLQGSYRNMNKLAEKVTAVMNDAEMQQLLDDHYQGEAQLLTLGAEENLLKLAELRNHMSEPQQTRWETIKQNFRRNQSIGGAEGDVGGKIVAQLADLVSATSSQNGQGIPWFDVLERSREYIAGQERSNRFLRASFLVALRRLSRPGDPIAQALESPLQDEESKNPDRTDG